VPRPQKNRIVSKPPLYSSFKPTGVRKRGLEQVALSLDEYEAVRLADYLQQEHEEAAVQMEISRSTFTRLLERARKKVATFMVEGRELCVEGGCVHFRKNLMRCLSCGELFSSGFDEELSVCPICGSAEIEDMADGFGHGNCCRQYSREKLYNDRRKS
jgi:predicted DNA-binding protein (UPF0251 family)